MTGLHITVTATLTRQGNDLLGVVQLPNKTKAAEPRPIPRREWDTALAEHADAMADGDTVDVEVTIDRASGARTVRLAGAAPLAKVPDDGDRRDAVRAGGFVNPYTFVPTLPRTGLDDTGLDNGAPPSHAYHATGQWSGTLVVTLTTVSPLLLPVPAPDQPADGPRVFDVRVGPDGRPAIHGASFKGALRSAYEIITASRYGVFFEHHEPLAYRVPAGEALGLTPARVHRHDGAISFRLCQGDAAWRQTSQNGNEVQHAAWVPAYRTPGLLRRLGDLRCGSLTDHHGQPVWARVALYQYARTDQWGRSTRFQVWRTTHLAPTEHAIIEALADNPAADPQRCGNLTLVDGVSPRIVRGRLSATGRSIKNKHDERLFIDEDGTDIPVTGEHRSFWQAVLRAYDVAAGYNDPKATYSRTPADADGIERSGHVPSNARLRELPEGTLVYVKLDPGGTDVTEVHPVMIGRRTFGTAPAALLHESLRPTDNRDQLSPADRLFGWVPAGRRGDSDDTNDGSSGYRGRLRIRSITCTTDDWRPPQPFPAGGVTLAPLSSPKPTQFRFYASGDQTTGLPVQRRAAKTTGYSDGGGLRGRKMYRWRAETPAHWQPPADHSDPDRGYLALTEQRSHPKQLVRHRRWVRPGVTFRVTIALDGVPEAELGALLWLLTRGESTPLRLGAGKPYGFGVIAAGIDMDHTRLWDSVGVRANWLRLDRCDPVPADQLTTLAERFAGTARANPVLAEATESYLAATRAVTDPVHYPRVSPEPAAESYLWFVANEKPRAREITHGWALPHVRHPQQQLPYLNDDDATDAGHHGNGGRAPGQPARRGQGGRGGRPR